jgi:hypothetical protein
MTAKKKLDECAKKVKARVKVWPSARASQQVAKCRKAKGKPRKGKKGSDLKRWDKEEWKNTKTGESCGNSKKGKGYCRPTKKVSSKTPKTKSEMKPSQVKVNQKRKSQGKRAKSTKSKS